MTKQEQIEEMARDLCECYNEDGTCSQDDSPCDLKCEYSTEALYLFGKGYRKQAEGEHICCKDCKFSECCVVQIHTYSEEIAAELHFSDPNEFYCAFAKMKGGE